MDNKKNLDMSLKDFIKDILDKATKCKDKNEIIEKLNGIIKDLENEKEH